VKVRFLAPGRDTTGSRRESTAFTVGGEYVVLAIRADNAGVQFLVLDDLSREPAWLNAKEFDLVSDEIPSNWAIQVGSAGAVDIVYAAPPSWRRPGFFDEYWSDDPKLNGPAREVFEREVAVITRESG
jgi:hypothetical protein